MRVLSLFDGMACGHIALTEMGIPIEKYDAYEIDKYAIQTATHNFPDIIEKGNVFDEDFSKYEGEYDLLIGGSPCTYWSIAQKNNRETEASGMGWELFSRYVRALKEVKPKYFLYENNKSMSKAIKQSISEAFGFEPILINSALVSAQNRQRLYWCGIRQDDGTYRKADIEQPEDRGILLKDILEDGIVAKDKAYCLKHQSGNARDYFKKHHTDIKFEPIIMNYPRGYNKGGAKYDKSPTLTANGDWQDNNKVVEPVCEEGEKGKTLTASCYKYAVSDSFKKANPRMGIAEPVGTTADYKSYAVTAYYSTGQNAPHTLEKHKGTMVAEPINITEDGKGQVLKANYYKSSNANFFNGNDGMKYAASGVAEPINITEDGKPQTIKAQYQKTSVANIVKYKSTYGTSGVAEPCRIPSYGADDKSRPVEALYPNHSGTGEGSLEQRLCSDNPNKQQVDLVADPICVNSKSGRGGVEGLQPSLQDRIYDINGKHTAVTTAFLPKVAIQCCICHNVPQEVRVRKYDCDIEKLKSLLKDSKIKSKLSNNAIAEKLNKPVTLVEHWFRQDSYFTVPDDDVWFDLKKLINIDNTEFDDFVTVFDERNGVFEKADRCYDVEGKMSTLTTQKTDNIIQPLQVGSLPRPNGELSTSQAFRVYSTDGKSVGLKAQGGGAGGKTGLYAVDIGNTPNKVEIGDMPPYCQQKLKEMAEKLGYIPTMMNFYNLCECDEKSPTMTTQCGSWTSSSTVGYVNDAKMYAIPTEFDDNNKPIKAKSFADGKIYTVYEVKDELITIKGKEYPIKLKDGYYIIRKLTVKECMRLQTVPEWYEFVVSDTQAYKMLGNGWTVEVIKHLLKGMIEDDERGVC